MLFVPYDGLSIDLQQMPVIAYYPDEHDINFYTMELDRGKTIRFPASKVPELREALNEGQENGVYLHRLFPSVIINPLLIISAEVKDSKLKFHYQGGSWTSRPTEDAYQVYEDYLSYVEDIYTPNDSPDDDSVKENLAALAEPALQDGEKQATYKISDKKLEALLSQWGRDLTDEAKRGLLQPITGRDKEVGETQAILLQKEKGNPILLGEAGVGKTAVVEQFAQDVAAGHVPEKLKNARVIMLNLSAMDNTKYKGEFQGKLFPLLDGILERNQNGEHIILFVDEFHSGMEAGASSSDPSVSEYLKPYLTNPYFRMIAATTEGEYQEHVVRNQALNRRFLPVKIGEPDEQATLAILEERRRGFEKHYGISIPAGSVKYFYDMTQTLLPNSFQPDKSIAALDNACSRAVLNGAKTLEEDHANEALARLSGLPDTFFKQEENERYRTLAAALKTKVFGQDAAMEQIAQIVQRGQAGLSGAKRPRASIMLKGPHGIGKSETGYALAEALCGGRDKAVIIDMATYADGYDAKYKLLGLSTTRAGEGREGDLTGPVRRNPSSVVMFRNIDKAPAEALDILRSVINNGEIKDAAGKRISFRNTIVLMNNGNGKSVPQASISGTVEYQPLTGVAHRQILSREWNTLQVKVKDRWKVDLSIAEAAKTQALALAAEDKANMTGDVTMGFAGASAPKTFNGQAVVSAFEAAVVNPLSEWLVTQGNPRRAFNAAAPSKNDNLRAVTITGAGKEFKVAEEKPAMKQPRVAISVGRAVSTGGAL